MIYSNKMKAANLLQAMKAEDINEIKSLLDSHVDLKVKIDNVTLLTYAVMVGNIEIISLLIEAGAKIDQRSGNSFTPLAHAAVCGALGEFMTLAAAGAKLNLTYTININGNEAKHNPLLILAIIGGSIEVCDYILQNGGGLELTGDSGISPLLASLHWDKPSILDYLLSAGADPEPVCSAKGIAALNWMPPIMVAASKGSAVALTALLSKGVDVNRTGSFGLSPMKLAVISGNIEAVRVLLDAGAMVDYVDMEGWTPLMNAATEGDVEITALLTRWGANPNHIVGSNKSSKHDGRTALMNAALNGHIDVIEVLLNAGANVNIETPLGESALSHALKARVRSSRLVSLASNLVEFVESVGEAQEFGGDLELRSLKVIEILLTHGADINCRVDGVGVAAFIYNTQDAELLQHFKKLGANIDRIPAHVPTGVVERLECLDACAVKTHWEIIRSKGTRDQISDSSLLMEEITLALASIKPENSEILKEVESLISAIGLSQESFDPVFEICEKSDGVKNGWTYDDRTSSMVSGPFYTSKKYPRNKSWMPIVQIDLSEMASLKGFRFGEGLLQLWYPIGADPTNAENAIIVMVPTSDISQKLITPWKYYYDPEPCEICVSPVPAEWSSFFWVNEEGYTHVIKGVVSRGIRCPDRFIQRKSKLIEKFMSSEIRLKIEKFIDICKFNNPSSPKGEVIELGLFGTFQLDEDDSQLYDINDVGLPCLLNIPGWGGPFGAHQAHLFYEVVDGGRINFKFKDYWVGPGYDTTRDINLYMGIK